jgi:hypothetical protein
MKVTTVMVNETIKKVRASESDQLLQNPTLCHRTVKLTWPLHHPSPQNLTLTTEPDPLPRRSEVDPLHQNSEADLDPSP